MALDVTKCIQGSLMRDLAVDPACQESYVALELLSKKLVTGFSPASMFFVCVLCVHSLFASCIYVDSLSKFYKVEVLCCASGSIVHLKSP